MSETLRFRRSIALGFTLALGLTACGGQSDAGSKPSSERFTLTFDDLGTPPPIIEVYPGVSESAHDHEQNGTFNDGDTVAIQCKKTGRTVNSHPELGEPKRSSNLWFRIIGSPGKVQYASEVYAAEIDGVTLQNIPDCEN